MNKLLLFVPLAILLQGCATWERSWNLGACQESRTGSYGCTVTIPKSATGAELIANVSSTTGSNTPQSIDLKLRLQNKESRSIGIQGVPGGNVYLKPGDSLEVLTKPGAGGQRYACFLDTSDGPIKLGIEIPGGKPKEATVRIMAHSSDAL